MSNKVWVYIDQLSGTALPVSWEVLAAAKQIASQLGGGVSALVFGSGVDSVAQEAFQYGADEVLLADDAALADYRAEPYATVLSKLAGEASPEVILFPTTIRGREVAAMGAVDLSAGVLPDAVALEVKDGSVHVTRSVFGGKLLTHVVSQAKPAMITVRGRIFEKPALDASCSGTPTKVDVALSDSDLKSKVVEFVKSEGGASVADAGVIVTGGRGVSNNAALTPPSDLSGEDAELWLAKEGLKNLEALAELLNGAVGASRSAVDAGYISYEHQIGQTGKIVTPDLYIACAISGSIQHLAGMRNSKVIVAVNNDEDAPIFKFAHYGVCADMHEVVPALTDALRERLGK